MKDRSRGDRVFQAAVYAIIVLIAVFTLYPLIYSLSASVSEPREILNGHVWLYPVNITTNAYQRVFRSADIQSGYLNTIIYAVAGTALNLLMTIAAAYPLSMKDMKGRNFITIMITFTMLFSGGMIPTYINIKNLGLLNTRWSVILPGLINVTNLLILRNYFINSVPDELHEAAEIDGASKITQFFHITLPMVSPTLFVVLIMRLMASMKVYDLIYMMVEDTNPALTSVQSLMYLFYRESFVAGSRGYGSAIVIWTVLLIGIVTIIQFVGQKKWVNYEI